MKAHAEGTYRVEAGALEALVALGNQDPETFDWAKEYLPVAEQNRSMWEHYNIVVLGCVESNHDRAREELRAVWQAAPYYRDPAGIAPKLGLKVPPTFEEAREEKDATTKRDDEISKVRATAGAASGRENAKWQDACKTAQSDLSGGIEPRLLGWSDASDNVAYSIVVPWRQKVQLEQEEARAKSQARGFMNTLSISWNEGGVFFVILGVELFISAVIACAITAVVAPLIAVISGFRVDSEVTSPILFLFFLFFLVVVALSPLLWLVSRFRAARKRRLPIATQEKQIIDLANQWMSLAEPEHLRRLADIESDVQRLMNRIQSDYVTQLARIEDEHRRKLMDIAARYQNM